MAAGFSIYTSKIIPFKKRLENYAQKTISRELLKKTIKVELEIGYKDLSYDLIETLNRLEPYGIGNPTPLFLTKGLKIIDFRGVGSDMKHLKFVFENSNITHEAIGFGMAEKSQEIRKGDIVDIIYSVSVNVWNGNRKIDLKLKDISNTYE
jgi:single-stranded-DNA-specific exonuclease